MIAMLQVFEIRFNSAEVRRLAPKFPSKIDVDVGIDRVSRRDPTSLAMDFTYSVKYHPEVATVKLQGIAMCNGTPDVIAEVLSEYEKTGKVPERLGANVINMVNTSAGLNTVFFMRTFNLIPPFIPPPLMKPGLPPGRKSPVPPGRPTIPTKSKVPSKVSKGKTKK